MGREFDETTVAVVSEVTTEVPEKVTTTTEKVKPTTIKAETPKPTTVKTEEEEEPDYYEEIDVTPVTKKPLSAADKQWIQNILSRTTKATTTTTTTTTTTPAPTTQPPPPPTQPPVQFRQPQASNISQQKLRQFQQILAQQNAGQQGQ